ncbi:TIGR01777 family oxidoreductase [Tumebacillus sp. ITR2]|uniref:TIGR01777 family oxidoreductase n=1 Tax=Tumebacillus amylolyticus TaxID=2801339 RepID=A0ABS1J855_9BACL|nr:TIGR01777 family oxidoreductase [Tumebacillus amylolyticus]MBL0386455.1 TIGR01777 family oxidoreductase [Tumebacillus amylolyticus]
MKIAIAGGSGFIGQHLISNWLQNKHEVFLISRSQQPTSDPLLTSVTWKDLEQNPHRLEGVEAIVNLAGESINQRWTEDAKRRILQSRLDTTGQIADFVAKLENKPAVVVNASGMSIYGLSETATFDENSPHIHDHFLSDVVEEWEKAADEISASRIVKVRVGIVLGMDGGAFPKMFMPYRLFVGGKVGNGRQVLSWIHIEDMVRLIDFCIENPEVAGAVNGTAPNPLTNDQFGRIVGRVAGRPHWMPVPSFMMKLLFGELSVLLLEGQRVLPKKVLDHGFQFRYPTLDVAMKQLLGK